MYKTRAPFPETPCLEKKRERKVKYLAKHLQKQQFNAHRIFVLILSKG